MLICAGSAAIRSLCPLSVWEIVVLGARFDRIVALCLCLCLCSGSESRGALGCVFPPSWQRRLHAYMVTVCMVSLLAFSATSHSLTLSSSADGVRVCAGHLGRVLRSVKGGGRRTRDKDKQATRLGGNVFKLRLRLHGQVHRRWPVKHTRDANPVPASDRPTPESLSCPFVVCRALSESIYASRLTRFLPPSTKQNIRALRPQ